MFSHSYLPPTQGKCRNLKNESLYLGCSAMLLQHFGFYSKFGVEVGVHPSYRKR